MRGVSISECITSSLNIALYLVPSYSSDSLRRLPFLSISAFDSLVCLPPFPPDSCVRAASSSADKFIIKLASAPMTPLSSDDSGAIVMPSSFFAVDPCLPDQACLI